MNKNNFFIKEGYINNPITTFNDSDVEEYWTEQRIKTSAIYQYHIYEYAAKLFEKNNFKSILDIGSGPGTKAKLFFKGIADDITLIDQPSVKHIAGKIFPEAIFRGYNLEEETISIEHQYDMVICADVIEHLGNPNTLVASIKNSIKPKGKGIISTPERNIRRGKRSNQSPNPQHVREWSNKELITYLNSQGLKTIESFLMPMKKLNVIEYKFSRSIGKFLMPKHIEWFANQMLIVEPDTNA